MKKYYINYIDSNANINKIIINPDLMNLNRNSANTISYHGKIYKQLENTWHFLNHWLTNLINYAFSAALNGYKKFTKLWRGNLSEVDQKTTQIAFKIKIQKQVKGPFERLSKENILGLQNQIQITNPKYPVLNLASLPPSLLPQDKYTIEGVDYYCSNAWKLDDSHYGVLALVQVEDKIYPRLFYLSVSQGSWRCMPGATKNEKGLAHYGKGYIESDTQLPIKLNIALHQRGLGNASNQPADNTIFNIVKTCYIASETYAEKIHIENFVELLGPKIFINNNGWILKPLSPPKELPKEPQQPDFSKIAEEHDLVLQEYGQVKAKIYLSRDRTIQYLFYELANGRAFLAGAEKVQDNPLTDYGIRETAFDLKNMDSPLLEYSNQMIGGDPRKKYSNNWNYVRELGIIQMYYKEQGREIPSEI